MKKIATLIFLAFQRCRKLCISVLLVYIISCTIGSMMVHLDNKFALAVRDKIIGNAVTSDKAVINYNSGNNFKASIIDFSENLFLGSTVQTAFGLGIVIPYFTTFLQGWIGGIVTVDGNHKSRFSKWRSAFYFLIVFMLQISAYSLCIGAGIRLGIETYKQNKNTPIAKYKLHKQSLKDIALMYILATPIFLVASFFEFYSSWN